MPELFVELLTEEIPARMQRRAADDLKRLVTNSLVDAGLTYEGATATAGPRRLVLSVQGLPGRSADRTEERKGPRVGAPEKALAGFLRGAGLSDIAEAEVVSDPKKGDFYLARTRIPGRPAIELCAEAIEKTVLNFPWPVTMRWGAASAEPSSLRWVRPLTSIIATFGPENEDPDIVPVDLPVPVGDTTTGHRVHAPELIRVRRLDDYKKSLERAFVVVDHDRRREQILHDAKDAAFALGLELVEDDALLNEVAGLVEWPVVLVGRFDETSLALPEEVIRLTIRENQKCFVTRDPATGRLANAFVLTANLAASDGGAAIVSGNERVVRARLADAQFFWEQDMKASLEEHARKLAAVTFHDKLGTQAERVARIAALAREISPLVGADPDTAERAARLAKADLPTLMVGEFPELQGYIGRHYAAAQDEPPEVSAAIEEHYRPLGPSDAVPDGPVSVTVSLADKLDTLVALWTIGEKPTGSGDAYGLRRAALGLIRNCLTHHLRADLANENGLVESAIAQLPVTLQAEAPRDEIVQFSIDRLIVQQREHGVSAEMIRAVVDELPAVDMVDIVARMEALKAFLATDDGANLLAGYKRATNILQIEEKKDATRYTGDTFDGDALTAEDNALASAIATARRTVGEAVAREDYPGAMAALAALRKPVDAFFEAVMVNDEDPAVRRNRLRLLAALRDATRQVADFGQISS